MLEIVCPKCRQTQEIYDATMERQTREILKSKGKDLEGKKFQYYPCGKCYENSSWEDVYKANKGD